MYKTLELEQDLPHQRRSHNLQRGGLLAMALLAAAALSGLFGSGPASRATARDEARTWTAEYDRFVRRASKAEVRFKFAAGAVSDPIRLKLSKGYLDKMRFERSVPEPLTMESGEDGVTFVFDVEDPQKEAEVLLLFQPKGYGRAKSGELEQFIYP